MEDIICTVPWCCGESDCPVGWHLEHYWIYDDGTYSVCDNDGNHDECDESDVPTFEQASAAWRDYSRHVAETGCDPLGEFSGVPRTTKRKERYTAAFRPSILGVQLVSIKRGGKAIPLSEIPQRVIDYLECERRPGAAGSLVFSDGWNALLALDCVKLYRGTARVTFTIEHEEPRSEKVIEAELRRAARRHLRKRD